MQVEVLVNAKVNQSFTYEAPPTLQEGQLVLVPFRLKIRLGIIERKSENLFQGKIKSVQQPLPFILKKEILDFIKKTASYNHLSLGQVIKMVLPLPLKVWEKDSWLLSEEESIPIKGLPFTFSKAQETISSYFQNQEKGFKTTLIDGVTGSGKTEIYLEQAINTYKENKQILLLSPEIALVENLAIRVKNYFSFSPYCWHSGTSFSEKREILRKILNGKPSIVIGTRSALFLPFAQLGLIIVDEEHDSSFKQEENPIYHARDMAVLRGKCENIPVILVSATPSLETIHNVQNKRYQSVTLDERFHKVSLPHTTLIDMRKEEKNTLISLELYHQLKETFARGEQALLFLNRRGYAPLFLCKQCGLRFQCHHCSTWLVFHKSKNLLKCHHCGLEERLPEHCKGCGGRDFLPFGPGIEKVQEEFQRLFPEVSTLIVTRGKDEKETLLTIEKAKNFSCLIGTQILAKGHHFPSLSLVGIIDADSGLSGGDLRASERTFQLLEQVGGRAGREKKTGTVLLQTYRPTHPLLQNLIKRDRNAFYEEEITQRSLFEMPPFTRLIALILSSPLEEELKNIVKELRENAPLAKEGIKIFGPVEAPLYKLRQRYRWRFLLKLEKNINFPQYLKNWLNSAKFPTHCRITIDIDPQSFL